MSAHVLLNLLNDLGNGIRSEVVKHFIDYAPRVLISLTQRHVC